mmetsp:Transcript_20877/g.29292  ORF Transcript_20877/g.29292 Transcript_20877/m.29292 type:complete len:121 (+) Transcript_20877:3-365(+)
MSPVLIMITSSGLLKMLNSNNINGQNCSENEDDTIIGALQFYEKGSNGNNHWVNKVPSERISVSTGTLSSSINKSVKASLASNEQFPFYDFENHLNAGANSIRETDWMQNQGVLDFIQNS